MLSVYADRVAARVILLDGVALSGLIVQYNVGVQDQQTYMIKRGDEDFLDEKPTLGTQRPWNGSWSGRLRYLLQSVLQVLSAVLSVQARP